MAYDIANNSEFDVGFGADHFSLFQPGQIPADPSINVEFDFASAGIAFTGHPARGYFYPSLNFEQNFSPATAYHVPPRLRDSGLFHPAVASDFRTLPYRSGGSQWVDVVYQDVTFIFPSDMSQVEIKYPVIPVNETNTVLAAMGHGGHRVEKKSAVIQVRRTSTIRFRVDRSYMATFMDDLHTHRGQVFRLQTLGYTPFGVNSQDNMVYVLRHSRPKPADQATVFDVDITFLFVSVTP